MAHTLDKQATQLRLTLVLPPVLWHPAPTMSTLMVSHPTCLEHRPGAHHPDSPGRLAAIHAALDAAKLAGTMVAATPVQAAKLTGVHSADHVDRVMAVAGKNAMLDPDTVASPRSVEAALLAAGGAIQAVDAVMDGKADNAWVLVRPPGHHATVNAAMGFCFFNNVAVAAQHALERGLERVAVVDWDVHHGNGTQDIFYDRRDVLFMSTHQYPFYPGGGRAQERGKGEGLGYSVNIPLPAGAHDGDLMAAFHDVMLPVAHAFQPQLVLVSAGFDAHMRDPVGDMEVSTEGFAALAGAVLDLARQSCGGKAVLVLEGGYDVDALGECVVACARIMNGAAAPPLRGNAALARGHIRDARALHAEAWKDLG